MAERSSMKWRVRGLMRKNRTKPLFALILAGLPMLIVTVVALFLMSSPLAGVGSLVSQIRALFAENGLQTGVLLLLFANPLDYSQLIASVPACALYAAVYLFIGMPISVSLSGFLLSFLRGKEVKVTDVFGCFSGRYPRILGGLLYKQLWVLIWGAVVIMPAILLFALYTVAQKGDLRILDWLYDLLLNAQFQTFFFFGVIALSALLFVIFLFVFINRLLAYHLTAICIAAQPRLSPTRAIGLSRKLMRGQKGSLIGLYVSFLNFYILAIVCGVALPLLPSFALDEGTASLIRMGLYFAIGLNLLLTLYVAPYCSLCVRAFYIERKREALLDEELTPEDFASEPPRAKEEKAGAGA